MNPEISVPTTSYGILQREQTGSAIDLAVEELKTLGFATIDSGYSTDEIAALSQVFGETHSRYIQKFGTNDLENANEHNTIRLPFQYGGEPFLRLAMNPMVLQVLSKLIPGRFILNQQNGVINPPRQGYNQGAWHRDLPYQHFVSSKPLAINALFCLDDFTTENGSTFVLPATHKVESFPSENFVTQNAVQIKAKAGTFILLDCMLFHSGGFNATDLPRRAVNHVYTIPYFRQQINIPRNISNLDQLTADERGLLGFDFQEPQSVDEYLSKRKGEAYS